MKLTVRRAAAADLPTLLQIFDNARAFMRTHGNPHQWPDSYPGAAYFRQAHNGMYLRMALLGLITGRI